MPLENGAETKTVHYFRKVKIITLAALMSLLGCSRRTTQRRLKQWQCLTSYNRNGSYYALPAVVEFDENGIWGCQGVYFSRYGSLPQTVVAVIKHSPAGMSCAELGNVLKMNAHSFIWSLVKDHRLSREKMQGSFVYMAVEEQIKAQQRKNRLELAAFPCRQLTDADAVTALVELVKNPHLGCAELAARIGDRALSASRESIEQFFLQRGLLSAQKKTALPDFSPSNFSETL